MPSLSSLLSVCLTITLFPDIWGDLPPGNESTVPSSPQPEISEDTPEVFIEIERTSPRTICEIFCDSIPTMLIGHIHGNWKMTFLQCYYCHIHTHNHTQTITHTHHNHTTTHARIRRRTGWLAPTFKGAFSGANPERSPILFIISWWGSLNILDI